MVFFRSYFSIATIFLLFFSSTYMYQLLATFYFEFHIFQRTFLDDLRLFQGTFLCKLQLFQTTFWKKQKIFLHLSEPVFQFFKNQKFRYPYQLKAKDRSCKAPFGCQLQINASRYYFPNLWGSRTLKSCICAMVQ